VAHVAAESRALWDDLREWVDLRVQLIQIDIEERIEKALNDMLAALIVVVLVLFALFLLLQAAALWLAGPWARPDGICRCGSDAYCGIPAGEGRQADPCAPRSART